MSSQKVILDLLQEVRDENKVQSDLVRKIELDVVNIKNDVGNLKTTLDSNTVILETHERRSTAAEENLELFKNELDVLKEPKKARKLLVTWGKSFFTSLKWIIGFVISVVAILKILGKF